MANRPDMASVMTRHPQTIQVSAYINSAKVVLDRYGIQQLPVIDGNRVVGLLSDRDIERAEHLGLDTSIGSDVSVGDICNPMVYVVEPTEALDDVLVYMGLEHIDAALIMSGDRLDGIFTFADACSYCATLIRQNLVARKDPIKIT